MKKELFLPLAATLLMTGCGSSLSCSSPDVQDTIKSILIDATKDARVLDALAEMKVENIATTSIDESVGTYTCTAQLQYDAGDGKDLAVQDVSYTVQPIESEDADFQVLFDKDEFGTFKSQVGAKAGLGFNELLKERFNGP